MKHAYLIISHQDFDILECIVKLIDDKRNDIFIHIDKKVTDFDKDKFKLLANKSNIFFVKNYDVKWGEYSLIQAEMSLFKESYLNDDYRYFHLISGSDMILKNQNYIHDFFEKYDGYEFISCATDEYTKNMSVINRFNRFHHIHKQEKMIKKFILKVLNILNFNRYRNDFKVSFGGNWVSITNEFVEYIIDNEKWIKKNFKYSHTCDEVYKQCLAINSKFRTKLFENKENICNDLEKDNFISFNLRYIDWSEGASHPKIFTLEDYDKLINSNCIFARKFNTEIDIDIIEKICIGI